MSVNSLTIDIEDWQGSSSCTIGDVGGGVLGSEVATSGTNGSGYLANDITLPADANKEICGRITYWPPGLNLQTFEDGSAIVSGPDGTYVAQYQLYVDYVPTGAQTPITFTVGNGATTIVSAWTEGAEVFSAAGTVSGAPGTVSLAMGWTEGGEVFSLAGVSTPPNSSGPLIPNAHQMYIGRARIRTYIGA